MPYLVKKGTGARPYKIVRRRTGEVVGTSKTFKDAEASIRARYRGEHEPGRRRKGGSP
jgi:hypothetical protein